MTAYACVTLVGCAATEVVEVVNPGPTRATMAGMSELTNSPHHSPDVRRARLLVYSDDVRTRERVQLAVGGTIHGRPIEWVEVATHAAVIAHADAHDFDVMILDGEAAKSGGMGIARQLRHELYHCPPIVVLVGRPGDAWLATWSQADAAVSHPLDPAEVRAAVESVLAVTSTT